MKKLLHTRSGSLTRNASWMFAGQLLTYALQGGYFILLARVLGSREYGVLVGVTALVSIASQFSTMGSGFVMLRHVSRDKEQFAEYWGNAVFTTLAVGTAIALSLQFFGKSLIGVSGASIIAMVAIADCVCMRLTEIAGQAFQSFEVLRITALMSTLTNALKFSAALAVTLVVRHATAAQWAAYALAVSIASAVFAISLVSFLLGRPKFHFGLMRASIAEGFGFSFSSSTTSVYNDLDKTMLSHFGMNEANGVYSMAYRLIDISCAPVRSIHAAAFPKFCQKGAHGVLENRRFAGTILKKTSLFAIAAAVGLFLFAPVVPRIIGPSFANSVIALRWLCLLPLMRSLHLSAGDALTGAGYQRYRTTCQVLAAGLNFSLNLYLIPAYSWRGAIGSSLITDGVLAVANWATLSLIARWELRKEAAAARLEANLAGVSSLRSSNAEV